MKYLPILILIIFASCKNNNKKWQVSETLDLGDITPIGLSFEGEKLWLADGDHNQIVAIDLEGKVLQTLKDFERPMHLDSEEQTVYIPEYGSDNIVKLQNGKRTILEIPDSLDAPAGVDVFGKEIAIADFYNHRIVFFDENKWLTFGKEGKMKGELYYPTDVNIGKDKIFVADAYNNRVQVFDKKGNVLTTMGENEKMNASTGIFANENEILITDFENNRVLVYNHQGKLQQVISEGINKPTDILIENNVLYIANYKGKNIIKMKKK
mgnify:CR=1 FL=1